MEESLLRRVTNDLVPSVLLSHFSTLPVKLYNNLSSPTINPTVEESVLLPACPSPISLHSLFLLFPEEDSTERYRVGSLQTATRVLTSMRRNLTRTLILSPTLTLL